MRRLVLWGLNAALTAALAGPTLAGEAVSVSRSLGGDAESTAVSDGMSTASATAEATFGGRAIARSNAVGRSWQPAHAISQANAATGFATSEARANSWDAWDDVPLPAAPAVARAKAVAKGSGRFSRSTAVVQPVRVPPPVVVTRVVVTRPCYVPVRVYCPPRRCF